MTSPLPEHVRELVDRLLKPDLWISVDSDGGQTIDGAPVEAAQALADAYAEIERLRLMLSTSPSDAVQQMLGAALTKDNQPEGSR